jgi:hypothetical protein
MLPIQAFTDLFNSYSQEDVPTAKLINGHKFLIDRLESLKKGVAERFSDEVSDVRDFTVQIKSITDIFTMMKDAVYPLPPAGEITLTHPVVLARIKARTCLPSILKILDPANKNSTSPLRGLIAILDRLKEDIIQPKDNSNTKIDETDAEILNTQTRTMSHLEVWSRAGSLLSHTVSNNGGAEDGHGGVVPSFAALFPEKAKTQKESARLEFIERATKELQVLIAKTDAMFPREKPSEPSDSEDGSDSSSEADSSVESSRVISK